MIFEASARVEGAVMTATLSLVNTSAVRVYVMHRDFFTGASRVSLHHVHGGDALLFVGTPHVPPFVAMALPSRSAGEAVEPGAAWRARYELTVPIAETGVVRRVGAPPVPGPPVPVVVHHLLCACEVRWGEGRAPKPAPRGGVDLDDTGAHPHYVLATAPLAEGVVVLRQPDTVSCVDGALGAEWRRV